MLIVYLLASGLGALTTFVFLLPYGWVVALLCAPLGGSALTLILAVGVSVGIYVLTPRGEPSRAPIGSPKLGPPQMQ
jgi:hypothetical protein